jgi:hypothetical protein
MREMRKKKGLLFFVFFFFFYVTPSSCSDSDSVTTRHRYSQLNENVHGPIMTRVERVKMVRERRIKGAKKDDGERRGERRRSYLKTHGKKLRSDGEEEEKFVVGDDDDEDDEDVAAQRQKEIEEYINRNKDCENEDHLLGAKLPSLEQQTKRYCEKDRTTEIVCLHRKMQYPETHCMASDCMFAQKDAVSRNALYGFERED